jgi:WXXGXW repeat (2 copies)
MRPMPRALISNGGTRLKKVISIILAAFFSLAMFAGVMPVPASAQMSVGVRIGPMPPPQAEVIPAAPGPYYHWDAGHWRWNGGRWVWIHGHYVHGYGGAHWVPGHYRTNAAGYQVWVPGHWR